MLVARGYKQCVHVNNWGTTSPEGGQNVLGQVATLSMCRWCSQYRVTVTASCACGYGLQAVCARK